MNLLDGSGFGVASPAVCGLVVVAVMLLTTTRPSTGAERTMFDADSAQRALEAIKAETGPKPRVLSIKITPETVAASVQDPADPDRIVTWRVSRPSGWTSVLGDRVIGGQSSEPTLLSGSLEDNLFTLEPTELARLPELAATALGLARLQEPGAVVQMDLRRQLRLLSEKDIGPPMWTIRIKGRHERAEVFADISGRTTGTNLRGTLRYQRLDLRAGGPDLDELVQKIRDELKAQWAVRYVQVETKSIAFEAALARTPDAPQVTPFVADIDGVRTASLAIPRLGLPNAEASHAFTISDADWQRLPEMQKRALAGAGIADGKIGSIVLLKPKREFGNNEIEWRIEVEPGNAPVLPTPNSPPRRRATAVFDAKGEFLRIKYPRGEGPKVDLLEPATLGKALASITAQLGTHLQATEVMVSEDDIAVTAVDPKKPDALGVFVYRDQEIKRETGARAMIANSMNFGPGALFDLAVLAPAIAGHLAAMEQETVSRLQVPSGHVIRLTFSKDRAFRPDNDEVLVEVRIAGTDADHKWLNYTLSGKVASNDNMVKSGIRVVRPVSRTDEEDCTHSADPTAVIAACSRLIDSGQFTSRNLAIFHYDRGIAHKNRNEFDAALADYSEAIRLDPNYANAYLNRAVLLANHQEIDRAMADFATAIRLDPAEKLGYLNRAAAYKIKGDWDRAISDYSEAIRLDPGNAPAVFDRGIAYFSKGDCAQAISDFTEAVRLEPKAAGALTMRGRCRQSQGDDEQAIRDFTAAIDLTPRDPAPYTNRAFSYRGKGEYARALTDYDRSLGLNPRNARVVFARGFTHYLAGSLPKALADVSQAHALDPAEPYAALWLDILGRRSGLPSQMAKATAKLDMAKWPGPVIKLYLGELTTEAAFAAADHGDPKTRRGQVCEVNFYAGEIALRRGSKAEAVPLFKLAAQECPSSWIEREAANAELAELAKAP